MQAFHAKAVQRLEKQRDEKAAENAPALRRLQARDSAALRELQQVNLQLIEGLLSKPQNPSNPANFWLSI